MSTKVSALTAATNAELNDDSLVYVVTDPAGTPASKKSTLAKVGGLPESFLDMVKLHQSIGAPASGGYTIGVRFIAARASQTCTGVRAYWRGTSAVTLTLSLYEVGVSPGLLASGTVVTTGSADYASVTFSPAQSLDPKKTYVAACYYAGGTFLNYVPSLSITTAPLRFRDYHLVGSYYYDTGDVNPTSAYVNNDVELEPLVSG